MQAKHHLPQQEWFKTATSQEKANKNLQCRIGILKKKLLEPSGHFHSCIKVFSLRDWLNPYQGLLEIQWIKLIYLHRGCKIVFFLFSAQWQQHLFPLSIWWFHYFISSHCEWKILQLIWVTENNYGYGTEPCWKWSLNGTKCTYLIVLNQLTGFNMSSALAFNELKH